MTSTVHARSPRVAAIDAGSNALRLTIAARNDDGVPEILEFYREPVRLGADVARTGTLGPEVLELAGMALARFRTLMDRAGVVACRGVATSAVRDAVNGQAFQDAASRFGIPIEIIDGATEARLVRDAIRERLGPSDAPRLLVDIGGGSVEFEILQDASVLWSQSFPIGTVRLLHAAGADASEAAIQLAARDALAAWNSAAARYAPTGVDSILLVGGNCESIADLVFPRSTTLPSSRSAGSSTEFSRAELDSLVARIEAIPADERENVLELPANRGDVLLPAARLIAILMATAPDARAVVPRVGLRDTLILELLTSLNEGARP